MAHKKAKPAPVAVTEPRKRSLEFQANMDRLVEMLGHLILMKLNPKAP
jgi:hypothetical protein